MGNVYLIAEIGINHNGEVAKALEMIDAAKVAGWDAVKFQKRDIDVVYSKEFLDSARKSPWGETQRDQKSGLEFSLVDYMAINDHCEKVGIEWSASAWDMESLSFVEHFNPPWHKIPSPLIVDKSFLQAVAAKRRKTFIATGMCDRVHVEQAVQIFNGYECEFELMHCVSQYPLDMYNANLSAIQNMGKDFRCKVGWSGHEMGLSLSMLAVMLGARTIERHITLDPEMYGSDQKASLPVGKMADMRELVEVASRFHVGDLMEVWDGQRILGNGMKMLQEFEKEVAAKLRAHIPLAGG